MTTIDTSADASAKSYHDSLMKATRAVIYASRSLRGKVHTQYSTNKELTSRITFLSNMEARVLKQVQQVNTTSAGLEVATQSLMGYQAFTKEDYEYVSNLGQKVALQQVQHLQDAFVKLFEQINEVQKFLVTVTQQPQAALPADASKAVGQTVNAAQPVPVLNAPAIQGSTPGQVAPLQVGQATTDPLFLVLLKHQQGVDKDIVTQTRQLLNHEGPKLTDIQITNLLLAWDGVVQFFTDTFIPNLDTIKAIVSFNEIHSSVEILYSELTTNVKRTNEDSLDSLLFSRY
jgi:hypothetical protein